MPNTLDELNNFLDTGGEKLYVKRLCEAREKLYANENIRAIVETKAKIDHAELGMDELKAQEYIYNLLSMFIVERALKIPGDE